MCKYESNSKASVDDHIEAKHEGICYTCEFCSFITQVTRRNLNFEKEPDGGQEVMNVRKVLTTKDDKKDKKPLTQVYDVNYANLQMLS